jgi:hypothetical protein
VQVPFLVRSPSISRRRSPDIEPRQAAAIRHLYAVAYRPWEHLGGIRAASPQLDGALRAQTGTSMMPGMTQNTDTLDRLVVRVEPALRAAVERAARADRRSVSNYVRRVLAETVDEPHRTPETQYAR